MKTVDQLTKIFNDNFMAYIHSHIAHVNVVGRTFSSDHALLGGVYEELQDQIDIIAELIRSLDAFMPTSVEEIVSGSEIKDAPIQGSADTLLRDVLTDLEDLKGCYEELIDVANGEGHDEIANYAQDRVLSLAKHIWMFRSTLD